MDAFTVYDVYEKYLLRLLISEFFVLYYFDVLCCILYVCIAVCGCLCGVINNNNTHI